MKDCIVYSGNIIKNTYCTIIDIYKIGEKFLLQSPKDIKTKKSIIIDKTIPWIDNEEDKKLNSFKTLKKQTEWLSGRLAAKKAVQSVTENMDLNEIKIDKKESGAPYLPQFENIHISITHSKRYAVASVSKKQLGIDLEKIKDININNLLYAGFSKKEADILKNKGLFSIFRAWTVKEAYLKYIEKGFNESLKQTEFIDNYIISKNITKTNINIISLPVLQNYILSLIIQK